MSRPTRRVSAVQGAQGDSILDTSEEDDLN